MAKYPLFLGASCPYSGAGDFLFVLRCGEGSAASNLSDGGGTRDMTVTGSPAVAAALIGTTATSGARSFSGSGQYAGRAAADGDETLFQWAVDGEGWGFHGWVQLDTLAAEASIIELGEYSSPETSATNVQMRVSVTAAGALKLHHEYGPLQDVSVSSADGLIEAGTKYAIGVSVRPSMIAHERMEVRLYVNGRCVKLSDSVYPPTGGASSRWIIGGSRSAGSAVGTPGLLVDGTLDDVVVCLFAPEHEFFRDLFGSSVRDYWPNYPDLFGFVSHLEFEVRARVLLEVGPADTADETTLPWLDRVNLTDVDLSRALGFDPIVSLRVRRSIDDQHWSAELELVSRFGAWNLSPFVNSEASAALSRNALSPTANVYDALLRSTRRVKIETAIMPKGSCGVAWDGSRDLHDHMDLLFDGHIVAVDPGASTARVTVIDGARGLGRVWIEPGPTGDDRNYGDQAGSPIETEMQAIIDENNPARHDIILINGSASLLVISTFDPATGLGEGRPNVVQSLDSVRVDGTVSFDGVFVAAATSDENAIRTTTSPGAAAPEIAGTVRLVERYGYKGGRIKLWTPVSPSWSVFEWNAPSSMTVMQHLVELGEQIGWTVGMRYDHVRRQFRLCFYDQAESGSAIACKPDRVFSFDRMSVTDERVRNVGTVEYLSANDIDPTLERERRLHAEVDATSARTWGRSYYRHSVGDESLINEETEAAQLNSHIVGDLKDPDAAGSAPLPFTNAPEPGDMLGFSGEEVEGQMPSLFAGARWAAVRSVEFEISRSSARTTVDLARFGLSFAERSVSKREGYDRATTPHLAAGRLATPDTPTVNYLGSLNGTRTAVVDFVAPSISAGRMDRNQQWRWTEIHMSLGTDFTPDDTTLLNVAAGGSYTITRTAAGAALASGTTYYVKVVYKDWLRRRSEPSAQASFGT